MREIVLATNNEGKLREFRHAFADTDIRFIYLKDLSDVPEIVEDGQTYEDNARIKALAICKLTGKPTIADDSGIEIDAIPGELGVKSARWAGYRDYKEVNAAILDILGDTDNRATRYVATIVYIDPASGEQLTVRGVIEGVIHTRQEGEGGFGYDPIFFLPAYGKTMAQLGLDEKNRISHRAKAIAQIKAELL